MQYLTGNRDTDTMILLFADDKDILNLCLTNKNIAKICDDDFFWEKRFIHKYGEANIKYKGDLSWKIFYLQILHYLKIGNYDLGASRYLSMKDGLISISDFFKSLGGNNTKAMLAAARNNDRPYTIYFIKLGGKKTLLDLHMLNF